MTSPDPTAGTAGHHPECSGREDHTGMCACGALIDGQTRRHPKAPDPTAGTVLGEEARAAADEAFFREYFGGDPGNALSDAYDALEPHIASLLSAARADERVRVLRDVVAHLDRNGLSGEETDYIRHLLAAAERTSDA